MKTKECKHHGLVKGDDVYERTYQGKVVTKCKLCINLKNKKYNEQFYKDEEKVKAKRERDNKRWATHKEEITEKRKAPERLEKRREAYHAKGDYYRDKCNQKQKVYRENLHDVYIKKIIQNGDKNITFESIPKSMIEFKRTLMNFKKSIKRAAITKREKDEN